MRASHAAATLSCLLIGDGSLLVQSGTLLLTHEDQVACVVALRAFTTETARQEAWTRRNALAVRSGRCAS